MISHIRTIPTFAVKPIINAKYRGHREKLIYYHPLRLLWYVDIFKKISDNIHVENIRNQMKYTNDRLCNLERVLIHIFSQVIIK